MSTGEPQPAASQVKDPLKRPLVYVIGGLMMVLLAAAIATELVSAWGGANDIVTAALYITLSVYFITTAVVTANYLGDGRRGLIFMLGSIMLVLSIASAFEKFG